MAESAIMMLCLVHGLELRNMPFRTQVDPVHLMLADFPVLLLTGRAVQLAAHLMTSPMPSPELPIRASAQQERQTTLAGLEGPCQRGEWQRASLHLRCHALVRRRHTVSRGKAAALPNAQGAHILCDSYQELHMTWRRHTDMSA